jgi:hypothetical protein
MVEMTTAVISNRCSDAIRDRIEIAQQIFNAFALQIRVSLQSGIQFVNVGLVMFRIMNFHCLGIKIWF